nr:MAG TPA: hypothetical protein [Caudoviricetes sp.]
MRIATNVSNISKSWLEWMWGCAALLPCKCPNKIIFLTQENVAFD